MASQTVIDVSRWQFAVTAVFHMTFPAVTVGLSVFLTIVYGVYWRTGNLVYLQLFRFWRKIFAVGFGLGVVAGTVMTFEFGLNWGGYASAVGPILGVIIGMEVVTAFLVEAGFIGILIYGDGRVSKRVMFIACLMVSLGTVASTTWILAANSWMQTPSGTKLVHGRFQVTNWWHAIFNPSFSHRWPHMLIGVLIGASWFVAGISAYYLRRHRHLSFAKTGMSFALGILALLVPLQLYIGDKVGDPVFPRQPAKLEALEGNWNSTNTGYNVLIWPDPSHERNKIQITIPWLGSAIAKDLSGNRPTPGLLLTPAKDRPNVWAVFYGFRLMFYTALTMFATVFTGVWLRFRRRLYTTGWFHKWVQIMTPAGVLAIIGGWITAETGRQPYVVNGLLRTSDAVSPLSAGAVITSLIAFLTVYLALLTVWIVYVVKQVRRGPDPIETLSALDHPLRSQDPAPTATSITPDAPPPSPSTILAGV